MPLAPRRRRGRPRARAAGGRATTPAGDPVLAPSPDDRAASLPADDRRPSSTPTGPPPDRAGAGAVLHRPVRQRQVDAGPRAAWTGSSSRASAPSPASTATSYAATSPPGSTFSKRGPRDQHPPDRLGGRRDHPARRRRDLQPDRAVRRDPPAGAARWSRTPAARSSSSTSPPRWRSASGATARASTPRRGAGEIPEFTGISSPYEEPDRRRRPGRHHRPHASRTASTTCWPALDEPRAGSTCEPQTRPQPGCTVRLAP